MKYQDFDRSASRVKLLVWSIAVLALLVGGAILTKVLFSLGSVGDTYQNTEHARTYVNDSLSRLQTYRLQLMARINVVASPRSAFAADPFLLLDRRPGEFEQLVVQECGKVVTDSVIDLGGDAAAVAGTVDELCGGLERMHNSLQIAWTQTFVASETRKQCDAARSRVRDELQQMLALISKAVGGQRLQTAVGLAKIRRSTTATRNDRLEEFVGLFERSAQPQQLENDMRDLILQTEHLIAMEDVDQLRSQKDNKLRQTLQRLRRNTSRLGSDADQFAKHLHEFQLHLFGSGSHDDRQHQSMLTTGGGLYSLKIKLLQDQQLLRASRDRADADARACQNAEMEVNALVAVLDGDVSEATHHKIVQASTSLVGIAAVAAIGFLIATAWIVRVVSRTMKSAQEQQRESAELARIIRDSPDELFIFSCETLKFVEANLGAQKSSGYSKAELTEMTPLDIKPKMSREQFHQLIRPLQAGEVASIEFQTDHKRKDGSLYPARISLHKAVYDQQDVFVAFVADVSAVQQLEQSLSKAQKLESVGQLAAGVAHEINTPMQL